MELPEAGTAVAGAGIVVDGTVFVAATDDGGAGAGAVAAVIASAVGLGATGTDEDAGFFADESTVEAAAATGISPVRAGLDEGMGATGAAVETDAAGGTGGFEASTAGAGLPNTAGVDFAPVFGSTCCCCCCCCCACEGRGGLTLLDASVLGSFSLSLLIVVLVGGGF